LEVANVSKWETSDRFGDAVHQCPTFCFGLAANDTRPRLVVGLTDVYDQPAGEPGQETHVESIDLSRWPVGCQDDLGALPGERVEQLQEALLSLDLSRDGLDVIEEEEPVVLVFLQNRFELPLPRRLRGVVQVRRDSPVAHDMAGMEFLRELTYRMEDVRLPKSGGGIEKERVVRRPG
jgi:hypothetical protein